MALGCDTDSGDSKAMTARISLTRFRHRTLPALLVATAARHPDRVFLRFFPPGAAGRPPRELTFAAFRSQVARAAAGLEATGVGPGDRVLLLAENSPEWQALALAVQALRAEPVALFASLSAPQAEDAARRVRPRACFVSTPAQWQKLAACAPDLAAWGLRAVLSAEALPDGSLPAGLAAASLASVLGEGAPALTTPELASRAAAVGPEDPFLVLFTSGTTGRQKGVRLPQRTIVHAIDAGLSTTGITEEDVGLHLLPFGHVAGHDQFALAMAQGHGLVLIAGRDELPAALATGPTYVFSVPLVYDRMRAQALEKVDRLPGLLRALVRGSLEGAARVRVDGSRRLVDRWRTWIADRLVGAKVRRALGGRIRGLFAGGAPASEALFRFFEGLGIPLVELYGMSETAGFISANLLAGRRRACVAGLLTPDHEIRFDADGELLLRGPLLFQGYLEPADGEGAFTPDGFFRTGDRGTLDEAGYLHLAGRKKHLLVLSTGKKVAPEPVETAIASALPFQGAVLLGEGRPFVAAAVFVAAEEIARLAALGKDPAEELLPNAVAALAGFSDYEKPKRLLVIPGAPQDHPSLVTPTMKVRREALLQLLGPAVSGLYGTG
jgi:long-chain acyl-CoA synthetase